MTRTYRPDAAPGWRPVLWLAAGAFVLVGVVALLQDASFADATLGGVGAAFLFGLVGAVVVAVARASRLVVDGRHVSHRQLLRRREVDVGPGWRLVEYRRGAGRSMTWIWVLLDPGDRARLILNGAMWSRPLLVAVFDEIGATVLSEHDEPAPDVPAMVQRVARD